MKTLRIGGVPEHFNLAWYLCLRDKSFHKVGVNLRWKNHMGGTGQMARALRDKEIDMAVILTEGIVREIIDGNPCKIVQVFVESPLIWGVHVAANSAYRDIAELQGRRAAISRHGSGSHLMAYIQAQNQGWNTETDLHFEVVNDLEGALQGLPAGKADYFMWERFTTKPYVDQGIFRHVGNCPTPWPCFVVAVHNDLLESDPQALADILEIVNRVTTDFKTLPGIDQTIARRYGQQLDDVRTWLSLTEWSQRQLTPKELDIIQGHLQKVGLIDQPTATSDILFG